jgi:hypothetical protein
VAGLANDIEVRLPGSFERPDPDIARDAVSAIKTRLPLTAEHIRAVVKNYETGGSVAILLETRLFCVIWADR